MNYCTKCESYYQKPGTCNCFAGEHAINSPWVPSPFTYPREYEGTTGTPPWNGTVTITNDWLASDIVNNPGQATVWTNRGNGEVVQTTLTG